MSNEDILRKLFLEHFHLDAEAIVSLPSHASSRRYYVLEGGGNKAIGVYGPTILENKAFLEIQKHLYKNKVNVPEFFKMDDSGLYYIQEYCGNMDVFTQLDLEVDKLSLLEKCLQVLGSIQSRECKQFDFTVCYPHARFDMNEVKREFKAFQHKYLGNKGIILEDDFFQEDIALFEKLLGEIPEEDYVFMHRDFQARNLLLDSSRDVVVIDFQGGRYGPRYYDLASLIYSPESPYAYEYKEELINFYIEKYTNQIPKTVFMKYFLLIALVRLIHILGVYGQIGLRENNDFFKKNISTAEGYMKEILSELDSKFNLSFIGLKSLYNFS